jgi:hypothetical protein
MFKPNQYVTACVTSQGLMALESYTISDVDSDGRVYVNGRLIEHAHLVLERGINAAGLRTLKARLKTARERSE